MPTEINIGGTVLTTNDDVVQITKQGSLLPDDIVGAKGSEASVVSESFSVVADEYLRATELAEQSGPRPDLTGAKGLKSVPVNISQDGNQVFSGDLLYKGSSIGSKKPFGQDGRTDRFELSGDGLVLWPLLENVNLRELDLGTVEWSETEAMSSWGRTADEQAGMFAPAVYGTRSVESERTVRFRLSHRDLRYQVYYYAIVKAIFEKYARYKISSQFFETDIFKRCVHTFGVGDAMEVANPTPGVPPPTVFGEIRTQATLNTADVVPVVPAVPLAPDPEVGVIDSQTHKFTAASDNSYTITIAAEFSSRPRTLVVIKNDSEVYTISPSISTDQFDDARTIDLIEGDEIWVTAGIVRTTASLTFFTMELSTPTTFDGGIIRVASCLPSKGVKEFLRGISHQFNLEWGVDAVRRIVTVEPRFPYIIEGVSRPGFYQLNSLRTGPGFIDSSSEIKINRVEGYQKHLEISYKDSYSGMAQYFNDQKPDANGVALYGVRFDDGSDLHPGAKSYSRNPYFEVMITAGAKYADDPTRLPHLWTGSEDGVSSDPLRYYDLPDPNYEAPPSCGFIHPDAALIEFGTTVRAEILVPLMTQGIVQTEVGDPSTLFCLSYSDQSAPAGEGETVPRFAPGLGSIFYPHLAASLLRGRTIDYVARITNPQEVYVENFRRAVALQYSVLSAYPSILLSIENYQPRGTAKLSCLTFVGARAEDLLLTKHYGLDTVETTGQICDYLFTDNIDHVDGAPNKPIRAISLTNGRPLPLAYPYNTTSASEATRLQNDMTRLLLAAGVSHGDITATITNDSPYKRWTLRVNATQLSLNAVTINTAGRVEPVLFSTENC